MPPRRFLLHRKRAKMAAIWMEFARIAKTAPPGVAFHTQNVVIAFQSTKLQ